MATFDTCIKGAPRRDGTWALKLRITHRRQSRWLPTNITVHADEVTRRGAIKSRAVLDRSEDLLRTVRAAAARLSPFALEAMDVDGLVAYIKGELAGRSWRLDFPEWSETEISGYKSGTAAAYRSALVSFCRWRRQDHFDINAITARDVRDWSDSLEPKRCAVTYPRLLSHLHRQARRKFNDPDAPVPLIARDPFETFDKQDRPANGQQSLGVAGIQELLDLDPDTGPRRYALDVFLLSFALLGVNFADLWTMAPPRDGWLEYYRQKTRDRGRKSDAYVRVRVPDQVAPIVERLRSRRSPGLWLSLQEHFKYEKEAIHAVNSALHTLQRKKGLRSFTLYAARHSWATIAQNSAGLAGDVADACLAHRAKNPLKDIYIERDWDFLNAQAAKVLKLFDWSKIAGNGPISAVNGESQ